jgi:hypothetical protein
MIAHVVLLSPRPDLSADETRAFISAFQHAITTIPTVRDVCIGRRVTHGAGYEAKDLPSADYLAIVTFDDLSGLQAYLRHPAHEALGAGFGTALASSAVYDFEVGGLEMLTDL